MDIPWVYPMSFWTAPRRIRTQPEASICWIKSLRFTLFPVQRRVSQLESHHSSDRGTGPSGDRGDHPEKSPASGNQETPPDIRSRTPDPANTRIEGLSCAHYKRKPPVGQYGIRCKSRSNSIYWDKPVD